MKPEFDDYAKEYSELLKDPLRAGFVKNDRFFHVRKLELLKRFFQSQKIDTRQLSWLDVGCGRGDLLSLGREFFDSVSGCDLSPEMLAHCESGIEVRELVNGGELPYADNSFDLVTAVCVYHHVPLPERAKLTRECARVVRTNGFVSIIEHNPFNPLTQVIVKRAPIDVDAVLLRAAETKSWLEQAKLKVEDTRYFLYLPEALFKNIGKLEEAFAWLPLGGQYAVFARKL